MRRFHLERREDETGVSGTGKIAEGVEFGDGTCVIRWVTEHVSTAIYGSAEELGKIHGHGGRTVIVWDDFGPVDAKAKLRHDNGLCSECGQVFPDCGCVVTDWGTGQTFHRKGGEWRIGDGSR